jgi:phytol kinase
MNIIGAILVAGAPLLLIELASRYVGLRPELARKLVHAGSSLAVVAMVWLVSLPVVAAIAAGFLVLMLSLRRIRFWQAVYRVKRHSWGEVVFPLAVSVTALVAPSVPAFVVAVLVMGLADTAAAAIGGWLKSPALPGTKGKTVAGTAACLVVALAVCAGGVMLGVGTWPLAVAAAVLAAAAEALTPYGLDNLTVPLVVIAVFH